MNQKRIPALKGRIPIIIDTREQNPLPFPEYRFAIEYKALPAGDYSIAGFEDRIAIERKSNIEEFIGNITTGRDTFWRELKILSRCDVSYILIESGRWEHIEEGRYRNLATSSSVLGTINTILWRMNIPTVILPDRPSALRFIETTFEQYCRRIQERYKILAHHLILKE